MRRVLGVVIGACALAAPSTAIAATVGPDAGGRIVFRAAPGEANAVYGNFSFRDLGAPLTVRPPCVAGTVVTCPFTPSFLLRDGDDTAWYLSDRGDTSLDGGTGDDDLYTSGSLDAHADGGRGDDIVFVTAGLTGYGSGNRGDDEVGGGGPTDGATVLAGGAGDDLVAHAISRFADLDGGAGDDTVVGGSIAGGTANGGGGNDVIAFGDINDPPGPPHEPGPTTGRWTIDGGGGADLIAPHRTPDVIHGGAGRDRIDALDGTTDTIDCGDGRDTVWADASDVVAADCEQRLSTPAPDFAEVDDALARAHALLTRPHPFPPLAAAR